MKQEQFTQQHQALWQQIEAWLDYQQLTKAERKRQHLSEPILDFPQAYRQLCHHLALAQARLYSPLLIQQLNRLVVRGHNRLYTARLHFLHKIVEFYLRGLPQTVRKAAGAFWLSASVFFGSFLIMLGSIQLKPELVYSIISGEDAAVMEQMYDPVRHNRLGRKREADSDVLMFGYYIQHNTTIGFQVFASGLLYGLGSLIFLLFNGLYIGAVAGHLTHLGYIETFWGFVAGHSAFELIAIVLSGTAGFKLAQALLMPARKSRRLALRDNSLEAVVIIYGAITLFIMAAFTEAFWSAQAGIEPTIKYTIGIILWLLMIAYFILAGRYTTNSSQVGI